MYAVEKRITLNGYGNTTFRKEAQQRGLEPDECYCLGELTNVADIAIEIAITLRVKQFAYAKRYPLGQVGEPAQRNCFTSGGIDKLAVYQGLGVTEVWFWQNEQFVLYRLQEEKYQQITRSEFLPDLDLALLSQFVNYDNQTEAVIAYRDALSN